MSARQRQRHPRFETVQNAHIEVYGQTIQAVAKLKNLSESGAFIEWDDRIPAPVKGDILRLTVELSQVGKKHRVSAEVIWTKSERGDAGLGVSFIKPEDVVTKLMSRY